MYVPATPAQPAVALAPVGIVSAAPPAFAPPARTGLRVRNAQLNVLAGHPAKIAGTLRPGDAAIISGATGAAPATAEEQDFLAGHSELPVRATGTLIGHGIEPQMVMNVALAALAVNRGKLFAPCGGASFERPMEGALTQAVVTGVGHWRGEGLALVEAVG